MAEIKGLRDNILRDDILRENRHLIWLIAAGLILIAEFAAVFQAAHQFKVSAGWFEHTTVVIEKLEELSSLIKDMERGQRGFLLTGRQDYIGPYREAVAKTPETLRTLRQLTADNPRQRSRIASLSLLLTGKMAEMKELVELRASGQVVDALGIIQTDKGLRAMGSIKVLIGEIRDEEHALLQGRILTARNAGRWAFEIVVAGSILLLALITVSAVLIRRGNHRCARLLEVTQQEIGERERAEEARQQSEDRFHTIVNAIPQLAWTAHADGSIYWYNQRWYEYTGTTPQQMEGRGWQWVHDPEILPAVMEGWNNSLATGQTFAMEFPLRGADGHFRFFLTRVQPLKDSAGRVIQWFGTNTDISERQHAEQQIQQMNQVLEQRIAIRTADLLTVNKELEAFSYSVSHDLRAPLRHMDGFAELLRKKCYDQLGAAGQQYLDKITASAKKMGLLIDDLLAFSHLSRAEVLRKKVNLQQLLEEVRRDLEPDIAGRNIVWLIGELPEVYGEQSMLRQVFFNLLSNALKYTRGRSETSIEVGCLANGAEDATVFVRDNGVGFEMEYVGKLFNVFQRLHSDEFEGTGVGLANVRRIVERHGGRVWAESVLNKGATFYFSLPHSNGSEAKG